MRHGNTHKKKSEDSGVATMIEYVMLSGIIMGLFIVMLLLVNSNFIEGPITAITYSSFTDVGNGLSTRIIDVYAIAPENGNVTSNFDLPDEIGGRGYMVEITGDSAGQTIEISRDLIVTNVAMAGIGASKHGRAGGNTTGAGVNKISYSSEGFDGS
jgi:hypothetical protein